MSDFHSFTPLSFTLFPFFLSLVERTTEFLSPPSLPYFPSTPPSVHHPLSLPSSLYHPLSLTSPSLSSIRADRLISSHSLVSAALPGDQTNVYKFAHKTWKIRGKLASVCVMLQRKFGGFNSLQDRRLCGSGDGVGRGWRGARIVISHSSMLSLWSLFVSCWRLFFVPISKLRRRKVNTDIYYLLEAVSEYFSERYSHVLRLRMCAFRFCFFFLV